MPLISKPNYNQIFASQAPDIDKPAVFNNYPEGWGPESRPNNGKPTIKGFNYLQQTSDLKDLWILQNGACLPYDESIEYAEGAPVLKDGVIQYKTADGFKSRDAVAIPTYSEVADGVDPVTGVANGAYFNVRSSSDESYIDEYQNVGGVATPSGKTYPSSNAKWDASSIFDGSLNQHQRNIGIKSLDQLRQTRPSKKGDKVDLISVNEDQNEGGGEFIAAQKSGLIDDGGLIVASPDPLLFWVRINYDFVTPEMFGAIAYRYASGAPNYTPTHTDSSDAIQKAIDSGKPVVLSSGVYNIYKPLLHGSNLKISGAGMERSIICKRNNLAANTGDSLYDVDAIIVAKGKYVGYVEFDSFQIGKFWDDTWLPNYLFHGTGYHAPYLEQSSFKNFRTSGTKYGIYCINIFMTNWIKCSFSASSGLVLGGLLPTELERGGTTNNFEDCWVKHVYDAGAYAWNTHGIATSTIKNCSTDVLGKAGSVTTELCAGGVFNFVSSSFNIVGYGCEAAHATGYLKASGESMITISNLSAYDFFNKYGGSNSFLFDLSGASRLHFSNAKLFLVYNPNEAGLPTPNFMRVGTRCRAEISNVMMYPRIPSAVNTSTGFDIVATDNAHVVVENDNSRIEFSIGQPNNTSLTVPAINLTTRGVQSTSESQDFGLVGANSGNWNTSRLRLGQGRIYKTALGVPHFVNRQPTGDWDGVPMIGASFGAGVAGNPLPCQLHFDTTAKRLMMRTDDKWYAVVMTEVGT